MPDQPSNDILNNLKSIVLPKMTTAVRDALVAELGTIIYNTTTNKINFCDVDRTAGAGSWAAVTSG